MWASRCRSYLHPGFERLPAARLRSALPPLRNRPAISNMGSYLNFIQELDLPEDRKEIILRKNAAALIKIDVHELTSM